MRRRKEPWTRLREAVKTATAGPPQAAPRPPSPASGGRKKEAVAGRRAATEEPPQKEPPERPRPRMDHCPPPRERGIVRPYTD